MFDFSKNVTFCVIFAGLEQEEPCGIRVDIGMPKVCNVLSCWGVIGCCFASCTFDTPSPTAKRLPDLMIPPIVIAPNQGYFTSHGIHKNPRRAPSPANVTADSPNAIRGSNLTAGWDAVSMPNFLE